MKISIKSTIFFLLMSTLFSQTVLNNTDLDSLRDQLQSNVIQGSESINEEENTLEAVTLVNDDEETVEDRYIGYSYFDREINFFDNIPTPSDFKLGPGDEITLSMWGETNLREDFIINKSGLIYYKNIGFINLSNKTLKEAESILLEDLSSIYSTLKDDDNQTNLMLELGKLKSVNVFFSGQIKNPGIALIHPFSDIFSAIVQSGGIKQEGSLRKVQLIRNGQVVSIVDFYSFFYSGKNNFSSIRILDGDTIHIPTVSKRIEIGGEVITNGFFEILDDEPLNNIIELYAGGYKSTASSQLILSQIVPLSERISDDIAKSKKVIDMNELSDVKINNGDSILILSISDVATDVEVFGRVKNPGLYPFKQTLKEILDLAGGFNDPAFRPTIVDNEIVVLRKNKDFFYGKEFKISYEEADTFELEVGDKIFVYENINYDNTFTYRIEGQILKPGTYVLSNANTTVRDALKKAGGLTSLSSEKNITVRQEYTSLDEDGNLSIVSEAVNNVNLDFKIGINSVIVASPVENVVRVQGNVYNPSLITFNKKASLSDYIELAGGYKSNSDRKRVYITRSNGNIERSSRIILGLGKKIYPGDTIFVPEKDKSKDFDVASFTADILSVLSNLAAILVIVDNTKD